MHRNTLLFVAILAVVAALLVGINVGRGMNRPDPQAPTPTPIVITPTSPPLTYLSGKICGVSYQYPNSLQAIEGSTSGTILANSANPDQSVVIVCQADIPRVPLVPEKIEDLTIPGEPGTASVSANLYHDVSEKDGTPIDKLIFTHPATGLDVYLAGFGPVFLQVISTLKLVN